MQPYAAHRLPWWVPDTKLAIAADGMINMSTELFDIEEAEYETEAVVDYLVNWLREQ